MKFKSKATMRSNPDFSIDARIEPIDSDISVDGSCDFAVSSISAAVSEIPIRVAIPFLKRRHRNQVVASIGGFKVELEPFSVKVDAMSMRLSGIFGSKGINCNMNCKVNCRTEMEMTGGLSGKVGKLEIDFSDDNYEQEQEQESI